jgi:hypothetical protein
LAVRPDGGRCIVGMDDFLHNGKNLKAQR